MRYRLLLVAAVVFALIPLPGAHAQEDPYGTDPHRLVPFAESVQRPYTTGTDVWQVWICDVPNWETPVDLAAAVSGLNTNLNPFFSWLSGGTYTTSFVAGGTVVSDVPISQADIDAREEPFAADCESRVQATSTGGANAALIVADIPHDVGYATVGAVCPEPPFTGCTTSYPANARRSVVGAATVTTVSPQPGPDWFTVAHEVGHTLNWTHSYSGLTLDPVTGGVSFYDNPMDLMSGEIHRGLPIGTIAYNRYAAGWIDPSDVVVHTEGTTVYDLAPSGGTGIEMLVVPVQSQGLFYAIGARRKAGYDAKVPKAGIEVYEIDQRRGIACNIPDSWPSTWPCFATLVRLKPQPPGQGMTSTDHVLGLDEEMTVAGFTIRVLSASATSFSVRVSAQGSGTFLDDDRNIHEPNIEAIAAAAITAGCNQAGDLYCPSRQVTRAEMAAFLIRAMGLEGQFVPYQGTFSDVPQGQWYTPYVETLAATGVTTGYQDGTYRPGASVSRAEMAVFLVRAFSGATPGPAAGIFSDVPASAWYASHAEQIYAEGVTAGCKTKPLSYCPVDPVLRDQMASFLARALGIDR